MVYRVIFSKNADADLRSIVDYISERSETRARSFVDTLTDRIVRKLSIFPESGPKIGRHRMCIFDNYIAIYEFDQLDGVVKVTMVTEGHRNWRASFEAPDGR